MPEGAIGFVQCGDGVGADCRGMMMVVVVVVVYVTNVLSMNSVGDMAAPSLFTRSSRCA